MVILKSIFSILVLISLIAIPFLKKAEEKREKLELVRLWGKWDAEKDAEEYLDMLGQKMNEKVESALQDK
jgi:hypothetical protein